MTESNEVLDAIASEHLTAWPLSPRCVVVTAHNNLTPDLPPWELAREFKGIFNKQLQELWKVRDPRVQRQIDQVRENLLKEMK